MADRLRDRLGSGIVVLGTQRGEKALLLAAVTKDLVGRYAAGKIIKEIAPIVGGGGGGQPELAQAGGKDPSKHATKRSRPVYEVVRLSADGLDRAQHSTINGSIHQVAGQQDEHLAAIERPLGVRIASSAGTLLIQGDAVRARARRPRADAALRAARERLPGLPERRRLRGPHPQPRSQRQPARHLSRHHLHLRAQAGDHAEERRPEGVHRRDPQLRHRLRHRAGGNRQDVPRHGDGGRRAHEEQLRAHDPRRVRPSKPARSSASCPAISRRRSTRICARSTTRCTTWSTSTARTRCSSAA